MNESNSVDYYTKVIESNFPNDTKTRKIELRKYLKLNFYRSLFGMSIEPTSLITKSQVTSLLEELNKLIPEEYKEERRATNRNAVIQGNNT